jgi:photosystem II stability/assembly factor-like uncharacterized protein
MNPSLRSRIRDDVLADYQEPRPDLAVQVLGAIPNVSNQPAARRGRPVVLRTLTVVLQTFAVVVAALLVAVSVVGVRAARGELALPAGFPLGISGLHPPAAGYSIVNNQFLSATTGWIVAQLGEHNGPTVLMNTADGGKTWHEQLRFADGSGGLSGFHFWGPRDGELTWSGPSNLPPSKVPGAPGSSSLIPRVYQTHDGGAHWQVVDRPVNWSGGASFFLTQQEGWRLLDTPGGSTSRAIRFGPTVQHTTDGGLHWTTIGTIPVAGMPSFRDSLNGWVTVGQSTTYSWDASGKPRPSVTPPALIYATHDGGQTWVPQDLPLPVAAATDMIRVESPVFFGNNDGVLPFEIIGAPPAARPALGQPLPQPWMQSYVLQTHDGGRTWSNPVLTPGGLQQGGALFFGAQHWLTSQGPNLNETFDAGKTWSSRQVLANGLEFNFAPWNYIDSKVVWSQVGANRFVRSTDGGAHWTAVRLPSMK